MYQDLSFMKIPLPEDVLKLKNFGDYEGALKMIKHFMSKDIPVALRKRLEIEEEIIRVMGIDEYPYSYEEALEILHKNIRDFKDEELKELKEIGAADWIFIDGKVHFQRRFYDTLIKTRPAYAARVMVPDDEEVRYSEIKNSLLNGNIDYMKEKGGRTVRTRIRSTIQAKKNSKKWDVKYVYTYRFLKYISRLKVSKFLPLPQRLHTQLRKMQIREPFTLKLN